MKRSAASANRRSDLALIDIDASRSGVAGVSDLACTRVGGWVAHRVGNTRHGTGCTRGRAFACRSSNLVVLHTGLVLAKSRAHAGAGPSAVIATTKGESTQIDRLVHQLGRRATVRTLAGQVTSGAMRFPCLVFLRIAPNERASQNLRESGCESPQGQERLRTVRTGYACCTHKGLETLNSPMELPSSLLPSHQPPPSSRQQRLPKSTLVSFSS